MNKGTQVRLIGSISGAGLAITGTIVDVLGDGFMVELPGWGTFKYSADQLKGM